ncbi:MAG: DUF3703 domain-containing protein [Rhodoferax sp.]|nr:DUF3703 domain-containing protein [Rhodoferax sp.]
MSIHFGAVTDARSVFDTLLRQFHASPQTDTEGAWDLLSAAHIVGQTDFRMHCRVHWAMLAFAAKTRDGGEVLGQLFRLGLVPIGHLFQRLPLGNWPRQRECVPGMPVAPKLTELITIAKSMSQIGL